MGPIFFIIYINDFCRSSDVLSFIIFAVDSNSFFSHKNHYTLPNVINIELEKVTQWMRDNELSGNNQKAKYMFFSNTINAFPIIVYM